jgi:PKD repeat protein
MRGRRNRTISSRAITATVVLTMLALVAPIVGTRVARASEADTWVLQNGEGLTADRFGSSDTVFITGVQSGGIAPASDVYVTENQDWSGRDGTPLRDVSNPDGVPNTVVGFEVIQAPIFLPHLRVGSFDVVIDHDQDRRYDQGEQVIGFGADPGFTVFFDGDTQAIDKERLKEEYARPWRDAAVVAGQYATVVETVKLVDDVTGFVELVNEPATWFVDQGETLLIELAEQAIKISDPELKGLDLDKPTSLDIREAAEDLRSAARGIAADPPDPEFRTVVPYAPPSEVEDESIAESPFREMARLVNRTREAAAYSTALLHAIERFDGAAAAGEPSYVRLQASAIDEFAASLTAKLAEVNTAASTLAAALRAAGVPGSLGEGRDQVIANQVRLRDSGFTPEEIQGFHAAGLDDDQIARLRQQILDIPVQELTSDLATQLDAFEPLTEPGRRALFDLQTQARNILDAPVGQAPVARDDSVAATSGAAATFNVLANDSDPDGDPISIVGTTQPGSGTVSCQPTGTCSYTSAEGFTGTDSFTYTIRDAGGLTATANVHIDVTAANRPPQAVDDNVTVATGGTATIDVVGNDSDPDNDQLRVTGSTAPSHGSATCPPGGSTCRYTGTAGYVGPDAFTYTVGDGRGGTAVGRVDVTVVADNQPPTVELGGDRTVAEGANLFLAPAVDDPDGRIVAYAWELGDGRQLDTDGPVTVVYPDQGVFTVRLTVTDNLGYSASDTLVVTVENVAPTALISASYTRVPPGGSRPLQAFGYDPGQDDLVFQWDFGDGTRATGELVGHAWASPGSYQVRLTVSDGDGGVGQASQQLQVAPALAAAGADVQAEEGQPVTLDGSKSSPADPYTSLTWDFGDGTARVSGPVASHAYADDGTYTARLTVADDVSTATDDAAVSVRNLPPVINGIAAPAEATVGAAASFHAFVSDPGPADKPSVSWDFGDGSSATGATVEHEFASQGTFVVTARADDGDGGVTTATSRVSVVGKRTGVPDSLGREFWIDFDANVLDSTTALTLFLTGPTSTSGRVSIPGIGFDRPFEVTADEITRIEVPTAAMLGTTDTDRVEPRTIHVAAGADVVVYGLNRTKYTTDAYLAQPADTTGTRYRVMSYGGVSGSEFSVVATANNTTVSVTPTEPVPGHPKGESSYTVKLDLGEAYELQVPSGDLTGTLVTADRPVAVFGGHYCAFVPPEAGFCDHLVEQLLPTDRWGQRFVTAPLQGRSADTIRILADRDGTTVRIASDGTTDQVTLDAGQAHEFRTGKPVTIDADHGVLVAQYSNGSQFDNTVSDPFMVVIPPFEQYFTSYVVAAPDSGFRDNFLNLVVPSDGVSSVTLDGQPIEGSSFRAIPGSGYSAAGVRVEPGTHRVKSALPVGVTVYGFDDYDSYGYTGGAGAGAIAAVRKLTVTPDSQTALVGKPACLTFAVRDGSDDPISGVRVDLTITGANPQVGSVVTGADGTVPFCYSGEKAGEDTVAAVAVDQRTSAQVTWRSETTNQPPTATPGTASTPEDTAVDIKLGGSDPEGQPLSFTVVTAPSHGTLSGTAPNLTYTPDANYFGADKLSFVVNDGTLTSDPATVAITVSPRNDPPSLSDPGPQAVDEGDALAIPITAVDPDDDQVTITLVSGPTGMALVGGELHWTPPEEAGPGTYPVTLAADDGHGGTARVAFQVTVREVNRPPSLTVSAASFSVQYSDPIPTLTIKATDGDQPRQDLSLSVTGLPTGITASPLIFDDQTDSWTARLDGRAATGAGEFPVMVEVSDGAGGVATKAIAVTVEPEAVQIEPTGAVAYMVDGTDGDLDRVQVPFTATEDADGWPSSQLAGTAGTRDAVPVTVAAVDPTGKSYRCTVGSLDAGTAGTAVGSCTLENLVPGVYDVRLDVDNGRFKGGGATVITVQGPAPAGSTGFLFGAGRVAISGGRSVCLGVGAWATSDGQAQGRLAVHGFGPGSPWALRSTTITKISTRQSSGIKVGEVTANAMLTHGDKPSRPVVAKLYVEDRSTDRVWIGIYDSSGRLLPDYSSPGAPPSGAKPLRGNINIGVR